MESMYSKYTKYIYVHLHLIRINITAQNVENLLYKNNNKNYI